MLLTRQARYAVDRVVLEVVKGGADDGEDALAAAKRETREEIGIVATRWDSLGFVYEIPSIVEQRVSLFLARDLSHVAIEHEGVESIEAVRMTLQDALDAVARGEINDAVTAVALVRARYLLAREQR